MNYSNQDRASQGQQPGSHPQFPQQPTPAHPHAQFPQQPTPAHPSAHAPVYPPTPPLAADTSIDIEIKNRRLRRYARVEPGEQTTTIRQAEPSAPGTGGSRLAYVHVPQDAPKGGRKARPPFTVTGLNGELLCSVRPVGGGVYDVHGSDGAAIGRITRRSGLVLPWPRRVHWTVQSAQGGEPLAGKVGTVKGWVAMSLGFPLYFAAWAVMAVQGLVLLLIGDKRGAKEDSAWELEPPCRTQWRTSAGPEAVIDYRTGGVYRLSSPRLDHRLLYAQAVLHVWDRG